IHHFSQRGARHGYEVEKSDAKGQVEVAHESAAGGSLAITFHDLDPEIPARVSTPILAEPTVGQGYSIMGSPRLYPGMQVELVGSARQIRAAVRARLFV